MPNIPDSSNVEYLFLLFGKQMEVFMHLMYFQKRDCFVTLLCHFDINFFNKRQAAIINKLVVGSVTKNVLFDNVTQILR